MRYSRLKTAIYLLLTAMMLAAVQSARASVLPRIPTALPNGIGYSYYLYDGDLLIGEIRDSGAPQAAYTWGADGLVSIHQIAGTSFTHWMCYGPQGETRQALDSTGSVVDTYTYTAYGQSVQATVSIRPDPFRWQGRTGVDRSRQS